MNELFPLASGLLLGALMAGLRPRRPWLGIPIAIALGVAATFVSGEYKIGWDYVLIDVPLVSICAVAGFMLVRRRRLGVAPEAR
jgi:hypothetical protein